MVLNCFREKQEMQTKSRFGDETRALKNSSPEKEKAFVWFLKPKWAKILLSKS